MSSARLAASLLLSSGVVAACGATGGKSNVSPGLSLASDTMQETFYEDNPTYTSTAVDDGFWRTVDPASVGLDAGLLAQGDAALALLPQAFSFLVIRHGVIAHETYLHGSAANQSNNIHSASKSMLSTLVGLAIERGLLSGVDATVSELLPEYTLRHPRTGAMTLDDLMTMTGGFSWVEDQTEYKIQDDPDWVQAILDRRMVAGPGKVFNYSTGSSHLVSAILTRATGRSTAAFAQEALFDPLGMSFEHWGADPQGINSGGYNLYMTPRMLARFGLMVLDQGRFAGRQVVPTDWLAAAQKPLVGVDDVWSYGRFWWLETVGGHAVAKAWGYGGQYAFVIPDLDLLVVMTANTATDFDEMDGDGFLGKYVIPAVAP